MKSSNCFAGSLIQGHATSQPLIMIRFLVLKGFDNTEDSERVLFSWLQPLDPIDNDNLKGV